MTKRIMFVGPSGIGKTTLAQYVAKSQNIPFVSGRTLSDAYDKKTEEWKREVFRIRGSLRQERIPGKKGFRTRKDFSQERTSVKKDGR